jgi:DNA-binding CsgD family transcriptional regulator
MTSSAVPHSVAVHHGRSPDLFENTCLRDAVARIAASLVRLTASAPQLRTAAESRTLTEHIVIGGATYRVRGEVLVQAATTPVVLVAIERHPDAYPSYRELRATFRLTRAEARVAAMLAQRMSNHEIARELGVTEHTARRHTEKILLKLGIHRRTDVLREMLRCVQPGAAAPGSTRVDAAVVQTLSASCRSSSPEW